MKFFLEQKTALSRISLGKSTGNLNTITTDFSALKYKMTLTSDATFYILDLTNQKISLNPLSSFTGTELNYDSTTYYVISESYDEITNLEAKHAYLDN